MASVTPTSKSGTPAIVLAAGGTGGHLFPAFALAQELARRAIAVDLVTDRRGEGYGADFPARAIHQIAAATLTGRSPLAAAKTGLRLLRGVAAALGLLRRLKPAAVVGFGGYPSFAPVVAARLLRLPTLLHEQNAVLGRANRLLATHVTAVATSFEQTKFVGERAHFKVRYVGNPVRDAVLQWADQAYREPSGQGPFQLLVFGGSQGARYFSQLLPAALALLPPAARARLSLVQQCRTEDLAQVKSAYLAQTVTAQLATFFPNLPAEMAKAHLVIARSGASTVAELAVLGRPAILVPLPHAIDNDQRLNAIRLAESGGAWCIEQGDLSPERLASTLNDLMTAPARLLGAAAAAKRQGRPDAVARLADLVEQLIGNRSQGA
ncbi:MAG TPA: undecaprenyldiphospho-muramoylpentapeptide beta-N-acetylglucosaminyltransferase [Hyphomicrobiaceae bacterium]|nr:undecaprenyldiphospho-muramoylpentapeptide beta-N-acetylglucosaminyltransferase [Hyphomicrobiaceae bacterium]